MSDRASAFGIEKVCVNEHPETYHFMIWQWDGDKRLYYSSPSWGQRRKGSHYKNEGQARAEWNRIRQSNGYEFDIKRVDMGEVDCDGK